jgi:hypothetical protein
MQPAARRRRLIDGAAKSPRATATVDAPGNDEPEQSGGRCLVLGSCAGQHVPGTLESKPATGDHGHLEPVVNASPSRVNAVRST